MPIDYTMSGKVVDTRKAHLLNFQQMMPHPTSRIRTMHATDNWCLVDYGQNFKLTNIQRYRISVPVSHQPCCRSMSRHTKTSRIVDNDQISQIGIASCRE